MNMLRPLVACALCAGLAACTNFNTDKGVGFTGIDGEPRSLPEDRPGSVSRAVAVPVALADLAPVRLRTEAGTVEAMAGAAIGAGGRGTLDAVIVGGASGPLMLSMVEVNGQPFAVLLPPEGGHGRMAAGAQARFAASVPRLTGCRAAGPAYASGSTARPSGLAVPLDCR